MSASADIAAWADRVAAGDRRALARALTVIENRGPQADALLAALFDRARPALRIGVTGAPGVGKSTLVNALARRFEQQGRRGAVLAVDPTSPFTGGAILGDRVRMSGGDGSSNVFIRSMATRGSLGGLASAAADAVTALEAAGYNLILLETVGVGQAEVDVAGLASPTALVLTPGLGDDIQALKAGVMEIADVFVLNKADQPGADRAEQHIGAALALRPSDAGPIPAIVRTVATEGKGLDELADVLLAAPSSRQAAESYWRERLLDDVRRGLAETVLSEERLVGAAKAVAAGRSNPYRAVREMLTPGTTFDHIGIAVRSIDQALPLWTAVLGVGASKRIRVERERVEVAMLPLGEARVELLEPTSPESTVARFLAKRGEGLHHIALRVPSLEAAIDRVRAQGMRLIDDSPRIGAEGYRYVFVHPRDTGGALMELLERE